MPADIETSIVINAPVEKVRNIFLDFQSYDKWTSFIKSIKTKDASLKPGAQLEVELGLNEGSVTKMTPVLLENSEKLFQWCGTLGHKYVFQGSHKFEIESIDGTKTKLTQSEEFAGVLKSPLLWFVKDQTIKGFQSFNEALKKESEK